MHSGLTAEPPTAQLAGLDWHRAVGTCLDKRVNGGHILVQGLCHIAQLALQCAGLSIQLAGQAVDVTGLLLVKIAEL